MLGRAMLLLWILCLPWLPSAAGKCNFGRSPLNVSLPLDSLECYNNYESYFQCTWREEQELPSVGRLQLHFHRRNNEGECKDDVNGTRKCRYETDVFSPSTTYTAFFSDPRNLCSTIKSTREDLWRLLRAKTPVNVTSSSTMDRGRLITWSSPYPQSSALLDGIMYQVTHRPHGQDSWTVEELSDTQKKLDKLIPGHRYEAKVRARVKLGHWSGWSPVVSWYTPLDPEKTPHLCCLLWGEREAQCSWEQSVELGHFISYQLVCRHNHTATAVDCCKDPAVKPGHSEDTLRFSCILPLPNFFNSSVELVPYINAIKLDSWKLIRPQPPTHVGVKETGSGWVVEWTPAMIRDATLTHEVRYYSPENQKDFEIIPSKMSFVNIPRSSLTPSRQYRVQVRSLVLAGQYGGPPSEWSHPVEWTTCTAPRLLWAYACAALTVALFLIIFIIPVCKRRFVLWAESIPSPDKSKVIWDIQRVKGSGPTVSEHTFLRDLDIPSVCFTPASLWPKERPDAETERADDERLWGCDKVPVSPMDSAPLCFSGPYILHQLSESESIDESSESGSSAPDEENPVLVSTSQPEEGYVCLPEPTASLAVQQLPSRSHSSTGDAEEGDRQGLSSDYAAEGLWPQGGAILHSGYCQLPSRT